MDSLKLFGDPAFLKAFDDRPRSVGGHAFANRSGEIETGSVLGGDVVINVTRDRLLSLEQEVTRLIPRTKQYNPEEGSDFLRSIPEGFVSPVSIDAPLFVMNEVSGLHWTVGGAGNNRFGTRSKALHQMGLSPADDDGAGIGVVVVDGGLSRHYVDNLTGNATYGGGWTLFHPAGPNTLPAPGQVNDPYTRTSDIHGNMIARNVLSVAPAVTIYDAPLLPDRISNLPAFSSDATILMRSIAAVIAASEHNPFLPKHKHWIVVNAWAAATSMAEPTGILSYAANRAHRLNAAVIDLANMDNVDVVFAAGNAGAFQPARLAGPYDRGHGRSIWGCNGLPEVHTVAAVRTDGYSIGASSQGPSRPQLDPTAAVNKKPDFAVPSWFSEDHDPSVLNTGTSAASALFAGTLATLAAKGAQPSSADLDQQLAALPALQGEWDPQRGRGVVSLKP